MKADFRIKIAVVSAILGGSQLPDLVFASCEDLVHWKDQIHQKAYQANIEKTFVEVATKYRVPIVFRESTVQSQGLQQQGFSTKGADIKNKSSVMHGINGFIPVDGRAGKVGDKLRAHLNSPKDKDWDQQLKSLQDKVKAENVLMKKLLEDKSKYRKSPVIREINGVKQIVVYTNSDASSTKWLKYDPKFDKKLPENTAYVLADRNKNPITADTDLVLIGHPKNEEHPMRFDPVVGFTTKFAENIQSEINHHWKKHSQNNNTIIQHPEESVYGLNPIDDEYVAIGHDGKIARFDLREPGAPKGTPEYNNALAKRNSELKKYGNWLALEKAHAEVFIPTEKFLENRAKKKSDMTGETVDWSITSGDYRTIRKMIDPRSR
jgi:hypothetical protein